jgi:uncharacterized protein YuzE
MQLEKAMTARYDALARAAYLRLRAGPVEEPEVSPGVVIDYDAQDQVVGIEFLNAPAHQ